MSAEAAVIDQPATETAPTVPHGKTSFADALAKVKQQEGKAPAAEPAKPAEPATPPTVAKQPAKEQPKETAKPAKPTNALDALLAGKPATEAKTEPAPGAETEDPLKDFPLDAKEKNWTGLRKKAEDGWARVHELEKKLGTPDPKLTGELETLRKTLTERETALQEREAKLAEYKDAMVAVNIELDPDHRREFIEGRKQLVSTAASKLKAYGGDEQALAEALALPEGRRRDEAVEALMEPLGDSAKAKIMRAVADIEALDERRAAILASPQASFEELQRKHAAQAQAQADQSEAVKKATFDRIARELAMSVPTLGFADETLDGGKDWNAARVANNAAALALLGNDTTPEQVVAASIKATDYDRVAGLLVETRRALAEHAARLSEYEGAQPNTTGRKIPVPTENEKLAKLSPGERYKAAMGSATNEDF